MKAIVSKKSLLLCAVAAVFVLGFGSCFKSKPAEEEKPAVTVSTEEKKIEDAISQDKKDLAEPSKDESKEENKDDKKEAKSIASIENKEDLDKQIHSGRVTVAKFYADWCGACKNMSETFDNIADKLKDRCDFVSVNTDKNDYVQKDFEISGVPTVIVFDDQGNVKKRMVGDDINELEKNILEAVSVDGGDKTAV